MNSFSTFGDIFGQLIAGGVDRLMPLADALAITMVTFAVIMAALGPMIGGAGVMSQAVKIVIGAGAYIGIMHSAQWLGEVLMQSSVQIGLEAGNSGQNAEAFLRSPDELFRTGYVIANGLWDLSNEMCSIFTSWMCGNLFSALAIQAAGWIVWGAFFIAPFLVLSISILFKISILIGLALLPLAVFEVSRQFGFMPIKAAIHFAVQLAVLACITGIGRLAFAQLTLQADPTVATAMPYIVAGMVFIGLLLGSSRLAYSLTSGAMLAGGALLGVPAGIAIAGGRSVGGHMAGPVSEGASMLYRKMSGAASASTKSVMR